MRAVAAVFVLPYAQLATGTERERHVAQFLSRLHDDVSLSLEDIVDLIGDTGTEDAGRLLSARLHPHPGEELFAERLSMGLRLVSGVDWEAVCERYGQPVEPRRAEVERLVAHGFATRHGRRLALTERGADVHSAICARLL